MFCFLFSFCCILFFRLSFDFVFKFPVFGFRVFVLNALTHENNDSTMLFICFCKSKDKYLQQVRFYVLFSVFVLLYIFFHLSFDFVFKFSVFGFWVFVLDALTHENNDSTMLFNCFCKSKDKYLQQVHFDVLFSVFVLLYSFFSFEF